MDNQKITWDWGTAYDLFCSLRVLHEPGHYGLRPSWAAGVRSRIPTEHRTILEKMQEILFIPRKWIFELPEENEGSKDGDTVLWYLGRMSPEDRVLKLLEGSGVPQPVVDHLNGISIRNEFSPDDLDFLREAYPPEKNRPRTKVLQTMMELVSQASEVGGRYLDALKAYQRVFFAEEEDRIRPFLEDAVLEAQLLAAELPIEDLIESLSRGVRIGIESSIKQWIFVPSYWISPLVSFSPLEAETAFFTFGGRPADVSLVPGDVVPEGLLRSFKALGDSTRLRILKYLTQERITPAEISRRLRLRAPTVTHHLKILRLAGLVNLSLEDENERYYMARMESIKEVLDLLDRFLVE
jgi:DNA-binding transcriptional ArsR family regulator